MEIVLIFLVVLSVAVIVVGFQVFCWAIWTLQSGLLFSVAFIFLVIGSLIMGLAVISL